MEVREVPARLTTALTICAVLLLPFPLLAAPQRLLIDPSGPPAIDSEFVGMTEISIVPPFNGAVLIVSIDGQTVARALQAPYKFQVNFGTGAVEHRIGVTAVSPDGSRTMSFSRTINHGSSPLSVKLREIDSASHIFEATATAPPNDPIAEVSFYDQDGPIGRTTEPPYRIRVPEKSMGGVLRVTAKARSGMEASDYFAGGDQIHVESYDVRTVKLFVAVTDRKGTLRSDISPRSFQVFDNGVKAKILDVGRAGNEPISVAMLIDLSASMTSWTSQLSMVAGSFLQKVMHPDDSCAIFAIQSVPRRLLPVTRDLQSATAALQNLTAAGETAIYDGIESAVRELSGEKNRRAIVLLTDGDDTSSIASFDEALQAATSAGIQVYVVAFSDGWQSTTRLDQLGFLAAQTGGFLAVADPRTLEQKYGEIERELREQYAIRYEVTDLSKPNEWRKVRVVVDSPTMTARSISGYFAP